ncbi:MAG TPA: isoamylase early set domain-containing protein [Jatrophihabitans sp.]|nr:isoamylase early set domain-containing protein [Jatrophihabitans sp.]
MAIRISNDGKTGMSKIQFVLPDDVHDGPVSAVGSFNGWQPGAHRLVRRSNGTRSVSITVPAGQDVHFRYLASGGVWFDDPDAHAVSEIGSFVRG